MKRLLICLAGISVLTACATPTPYQAAGGDQWGFQETQIESNRFRVSFSGNSLTDRETVETYFLYRAAELTLERGFDHFIVVQRATDTETRIVGSGGDPFYRPGFGLQYSYFHPRWGWHGGGDPFWNDINYREITRYEASAEIVLGRGAKPDDANAFDARDVTANLGPQIVRPEAG
ncbi:CC0125/CC1285 family lipoprotein [Maricaulis sp.]|uniref:CC0125/CC1285 family lipoprotein n=1 Tax=Maricaulis sp. TaxID=1486257 RepID=UPI003A905FB0